MEAIEEVERTLFSMMASYEPRRLGASDPQIRLNPQTMMTFGESALSPFAAWCSPASRPLPQAHARADLNELIACDELMWVRGAKMLFVGANDKRWARLIGLRGLADGARADLGLNPSGVRGEITIAHIARPIDRAEAVMELIRKRNVEKNNLIANVGDAASNQIDEAIMLLQGVHPSGLEAISVPLPAHHHGVRRDRGRSRPDRLEDRVDAENRRLRGGARGPRGGGLVLVGAPDIRHPRAPM